MADPKLSSPRVFLSYSQDSAVHSAAMLALCDRLRQDGLDCVIDQYELSPPEGWQRWMLRQIRDADFVLCVCTPSYNRRVLGEEAAGTGLGATWEGGAIFTELYEAGASNPKFIPVLVDPAHKVTIPPLAGATRYHLADDADYEALYRRLTSQPAVEKPELGVPIPLPPRQSRPDFQYPVRKSSSQYSESGPPKRRSKRRPNATQRISDAEPQLSGPNIWRVPFRLNPHLVGREDLSIELDRALTNNNRVPPIAVLFGLGGVGKSQVAVAHAVDHSTADALTWWINAENLSLVGGEFRSLAKAVGILGVEAMDDDKLIEAVHDYLAQLSAPWLLVFDNVRDERQIRKFLPSRGLGRIIITVRGRLSADIGEHVHVKPLDTASGADFLRKRTRTLDLEASELLSQELGGLPLALVQAGAYIHEKQISVARYLSIYAEHNLDALDGGSAETEYPESVRTTWDISFDAIANSHPPAVTLLRICSHMAPEGIPLNLIQEDKGIWPEPLARALENDLATEALVGELLRYSLVDRPDDKTLHMHRLVQLVVRDQLSSDDRVSYLALVLRFMIDVFPRTGWDETTWERCEQLLSHVLAVTQLAKKTRVGPDAVANVYTSVGRYYRSQSRFVEAAEILELADAVLENVAGGSHIGLGMIANDLGRVYQDLGRYEDAKDHLERGLRLTIDSFGQHHENTGACHNNLGDLLREVENFSLAKDYLELAVQINRDRLGSNSSEYATSISNLAMTIRHLGEFDRAGKLLKEALAVDISKFGSSSIQVAINFNNIGQLLKDAAVTGKRYESQEKIDGWLEQSKQYFEKALEILNLHHKSPNAQTATTLKNLGNLSVLMNRCPEARFRLQAALEISMRVHPAGHSFTAEILQNLEDLTC